MIATIALLVLLVGNLFCLGSLGGVYLQVTSRRAKLALLIDHLAALARRAMPLPSGLRLLGRDLGGYFGSSVIRVSRRLEEGQGLGEAFQSMPGIFPSHFRILAGLGEKSGNLSAFLEAVRLSYRRATQVSARSAYAFIYPLLLSFLVSGNLIWLNLVIVPRLEWGYLQHKLPSIFTRGWSWLLAADEATVTLCALLFGIVFWGSASWLELRPFRFLKWLGERAILWIPFLRRLAQDSALYHLALSTGLFLRAGATLPQAVSAAAESQPNSVFRRRDLELAARVAEGKGLGEAARQARLKNDFIWFVETGEAGGVLPEHLLAAAVHYETKVHFTLQLASRAMIPLFVVLNGLLVLGSALLIFVPLFLMERGLANP